MTLLELAHYKGMTIQAVCEEIKRVTGYELPCTRNVNVVDSIIKKVAPAYFNRKANTETAYERKEKRNKEKGKEKGSQKAGESETHKEIEFFTSDEDEIITIVRKKMSDCVILDFLSGGTLTLQKSNFGKKPVINKGDIVGLKFIDSPDYNTDERFNVCYILPKVQWQKTKIEKAYNEKEVILGKILYPFKDQGYFVNIYGIQAIMFNNQISENTPLYEGAEVNVAISSAEIEGIKFRVSVSQKWAESLSKQKEKKGYAKAIKNNYESIHVGEYLDTIINRIDENYIIVKYDNLLGIIYRSDLFWCNVKNINDHLKEGNPIRARVVSKEIKEDGKFNVRLSHKEFSLNPWESTVFNELDEVCGPITAVYDRFITIKIAEGVEGILHANNMTRMEFEALKSWTYDDDDVNVIIKSIDKDNKRIELCTPALEEIDEIWDNIHSYYEVDKSYKGNVISYEDNQLWIQLEEGIEASINKNEMSWTNSSLINPETFSFGAPINVFITHIDRSKRKIIASIKRLTPNPWETAKVSISVGDTCIVEVIDRKEKVLIVETQDSFHLIGRIKLSEISWFPLKQNEEPQIGWKLEAKVMVFQPEKYVLKLSVRQLQEDPWNSLYIGAEVNGTIQTKTDPAFVNVQLENKLLAKTSELEFISQIGKIYPFKVVSCNRATQEIIVSHKSLVFDQKTEEIVKSSLIFSKEDMSYKVNEAHQNFLIIDGEPKFSKGVLFPHNIIFDGEEMSLPFAMSIMKQLREDPSLLKELKVITRFGSHQEHVILSYDCKDMLHIPDYETTLSENTIYKGKVIAKTNNSTIIAVNGWYGYVDEPNDNELDDIINVAIIKNSKNKFGFCRFSVANSIEDTSINSGVSESIEEFLTKEELAAIEDNNKETIEWVLDNIDGITRKNVNVVREVLHLTYNPNTQSDLARFLSEKPQYFAENNFWIGGYRDTETNDAKLIMYDCNDVVLEIQVNESGLWVQEFSHDRIKSNAQYLLNNNVKALVISGSNVILHENSYLCEDNIEIGNKILNQLSVAKEIIPKLKVAIKTLKEKAGIEYLTLKEYLTYQENKEKEYNKNNVVNIAGNEATITTSTSNGKTALFLNIASEVSSLFTEQDEDVCHIEITNNSTKINAELKMNADKTGYNIEFYNEHLNIDGLRKDGFELRRRAGVRHLTLQKESIDNFVYGEGQSDIFEKLNRGELIPPTPDESLEFFDSKFVNVEEGNNQPLAIRKAVNNNDIFLIQGPPGTGKTSVIVEIIKQLVINRGEKVLVCSQAHSAVKNIYDRLNNVDERIKIGNIDEEETMIPDDLKEHPEFLKNNELLLKDLETCDSTEEVSKQIENSYTYKSSTKDLFKKRHEYICKYYTANKPSSTIEWIEILSELRKGLIELDDDAKAFNNARHYQGLNVVMGTCIGIGMNTDLQRSGIVFDTVIIDEAGKANLSETTVPMKLGRKYILVGDNKQLPPFMDTEDISKFIDESGNNSLHKKDVEDAISSSLFEDFLEDSKFPTESSILLNYQYRMNPDIGAYISELFYEEALKNGKGTEKQVCKLRSFPSAVTFIDTSSLNREKAYEKGNSKEGWYNPEEILIFKERLLPRLEELIAEESNISVGIITPYRKQRALLMKELRGTSLDNSVYTIDSIQGSEFDIVILSLVRAFNTRYGNRTVGFLDDMRRLNVALSRAKKKLIIIGNLDTLCDEKAHSKKESNLSIEPTEVFKKLRLIQDRTAEKTSLDILMYEIKNKRLKNGTVFENCTWKWADQYDTSKIYVNFDINGMIHTFPIKTDKIFHRYGAANDTINVSFLGIAENGRAMFKYIPNVSISEMIEDGALSNVKARMIEWSDDEEKDEALFEFEDGSDSILGIFNRIGQKHILWDLLESKYAGFIPLYIQDKTASLEKKPYDEFQEIHKKGDRVRIKVIDDTCSMNYYIVKCGDVYGKVNKYYKYSLKRNQEVEATIYSIYGQSISFNVM